MLVKTFFGNKQLGLDTLISKHSTNPIQTVQLRQVHSARIITASQASELIDGDGLLTNQPNLCLTIKTADCLPILFSHVQGVVGAVHAGRKGTQQQIIVKAIEQAMRQYSLSPVGFHFWFGPAICGQCYQVDRQKDVYFDLIEENRLQITDMLGSTPDVTVSNICTLEDDTYHSYRKIGHTGESNWSGIYFY